MALPVERRKTEASRPQRDDAMKRALDGLIQKAEASHKLTEQELVQLLGEASAEEPLAAAADRVRHAYVGDGVHLRGLIEFSNICRQNCMYCGLRRDNAKI